MTSEEIEKKEAELKARAEALDAREADIKRQADAASREADLRRQENELNAREAALEKLSVISSGKAVDISNPSPVPSPSTYATSIKLHVPITLDLTASNYTK